jgi:hypothetical protein
MTEPFEEIPRPNDFVRYRLGWFLVIIGLIVATGLAVALSEAQFSHSIVGAIGTLRNPSEANIIPEEADKVQPEIAATSGRIAPAEVVKDIDALTSANIDSVVGRKVQLTVPVLGRNTDQAFWVGSGDHQMLVAIRRDHRTPDERYYSSAFANQIGTLQVGGKAVITGTIERLPDREHIWAWSLSTRDMEQLEARPIYIAADSVQPAS